MFKLLKGNYLFVMRSQLLGTCYIIGKESNVKNEEQIMELPITM